MRRPWPRVKPDVVCLVEAWRQGTSSQPEQVARRLELPYHHFVGDWRQEDWVSGIGVVSRWPMSPPQRRPLRGADGTGAGEALHVTIDGERGPIQLFAVMLDYPLDGSAIRQDQVRQLVRFIGEVASRRDPVIVCGDFNAGPDCDEIRMLTGRAAPADRRMVFYDSWEMAETAPPAAPGRTAIRWPPSGCTRIGGSTTSSRPGRAGAAPGTRSTARCSGNGRRSRSRYRTTTGCWRIFAIEPTRPGRQRSKVTGGRARDARDRSK